MNEAEIHPHVAEERADLFEADSSQDTEYEYLEFLETLVGILKPRRILETGTGNGEGTKALAVGANCEVITIDNLRAPLFDRANITLVQDSSLNFLSTTDKMFDFFFLDSALEIRAQELEIILKRGMYIPNAFVAIHDTSQKRTTRAGDPDPRTRIFWNKFEELVDEYGLKYVQFPYSRGLTLVQL